MLRIERKFREIGAVTIHAVGIVGEKLVHDGKGLVGCLLPSRTEKAGEIRVVGIIQHRDVATIFFANILGAAEVLQPHRSAGLTDI